MLNKHKSNVMGSKSFSIKTSILSHNKNAKPRPTTQGIRRFRVPLKNVHFIISNTPLYILLLLYTVDNVNVSYGSSRSP